MLPLTNHCSMSVGRTCPHHIRGKSPLLNKCAKNGSVAPTDRPTDHDVKKVSDGPARTVLYCTVRTCVRCPTKARSSKRVSLAQKMLLLLLLLLLELDPPLPVVVVVVVIIIYDMGRLAINAAITT